MNLKKRLEQVTSLEKSEEIKEVITIYEKAGLFGVAGGFAEKAGEIKRAISDYEKAKLFGLSCELQHGRRNPEYVKKIEDGGVNFVLKEIKKYEEQARSGYYDRELEWGPEQWKREADELKEGLISLEVVIKDYEIEKLHKSKEIKKEPD